MQQSPTSLDTIPGSLKLAIIGYGKMGRAIETIALENGHCVPLKITSSDTQNLTVKNLKDCDVAMEFTGPETATKNIICCIDAGVPVVCGSTGWLHDKDRVEKYCLANNGTLLYASNFSIGVNIFFELNKRLATLMGSRREYDVTIEEIHHTQKKDAPSGTAISIAEDIIHNLPGKLRWKNEGPPTENEITITSKRRDPAPGTHAVKYTSAVDDIEIIHTAHNRQGFAAGALLAATFIAGRNGIFTMQDVLNIK